MFTIYNCSIIKLNKVNKFIYHYNCCYHIIIKEKVHVKIKTNNYFVQPYMKLQVPWNVRWLNIQKLKETGAFNVSVVVAGYRRLHKLLPFLGPTYFSKFMTWHLALLAKHEHNLSISHISVWRHMKKGDTIALCLLQLQC